MTFDELVMLKLMVSAPAVLFASWIAARNVHCLPLAVDVSHLPLPMLLSAASPVLLTTKVVEPSTVAGVAAKTRTTSVSTNPTTTGSRRLSMVVLLRGSCWSRYGTSVTVLLAENSEVLPLVTAVAVAVTTWPTVRLLIVNVKVLLPPESVVTVPLATRV